VLNKMWSAKWRMETKKLILKRRVAKNCPNLRRTNNQIPRHTN